MDGTATVRRPRGPNSPRKKVEKKSRKGKGKKEEPGDDEGVKTEPGMGSRQGTVESEREGLGMERLGREKRVKLEPGLHSMSMNATAESLPTPRTMPNTPSSSRYVREASASPSPGPSERFEEMGEMDEMGFSFGMQGDEGLPGMYAPPSMEMGQGFGTGYGMVGMQMGMGDPFEGLWHGHDGHHGHGNGSGHRHVGQGAAMPGEGVHVKTEPRWEDAYRHV